MSEPREPLPVKVFSSLFSADEDLIDQVIPQVCKTLGPVDKKSRPLYFDRTKYYAKEMGWPLHRRFVSFEKLMNPERLVEIKLQTNEVEKRYLKNGKRLVNIDPGYICPERLILATGKNYIHRVHLSHGIYADLTLIFHQGTFKPLRWTYPDYTDPYLIGFFCDVRKHYMEQLKEMRRFD